MCSCFVGVIEIAGSSTHSAAVTASGSVYTWGTLASSTPVYSPTLVSYFDERDIRISHIACGFNLTVVVSELGDTYTWGSGMQHLRMVFDAERLQYIKVASLDTQTALLSTTHVSWRVSVINLFVV